jgi:hypothetical protein
MELEELRAQVGSTAGNCAKLACVHAACSEQHALTRWVCYMQTHLGGVFLTKLDHR